MMGDFITILLEKLLARARDWLARTPKRTWDETSWIDRGGRLLMIAIAVAIVVGPLCWFALR
jgi:hypothetical protein